jgi:hypothetical protein
MPGGTCVMVNFVICTTRRIWRCSDHAQDCAVWSVSRTARFWDANEASSPNDHFSELSRAPCVAFL